MTATYRRRLAAVIVAAGVSVCAVTGIAQAAVTQSHVTTPTSGFILTNFDQPPAAMDAAGTTNGSGGDLVDIRCYRIGPDGEPTFLDLATSVAVQNDGSFTASGGIQGTAGGNCILRAVPHGYTAHSLMELAHFTGPQLPVELSNRIPNGPNTAVVDNFTLTAPQTSGQIVYASAGACGILAAELNTVADSAFSNSILVCSGYYPVDNGLSGAAERSGILVDGHHAFTPGAATNLINGDQLHGFPPLTWSASYGADGAVTIQESEDIVACSSNTFPPTALSCTSLLPTGVRLARTIVQSHAGLVVTITDTWSSTDHQAHQLDLQITDNIENSLSSPATRVRVRLGLA